MAVPAYATDLNDIYTDGGSWTTLTGRVTDPDTDDYIQGASCWSHDPFSSGIEGGVVNSSETITAGHAVFIWTKSDIGPALATRASGGVQALIGNLSTALKCFYILGSDDLIYGGWKCIPVDPTKTQSTSVGSPSSVTAYFGVRWNIPGSGPTKGYPLKIDAMRWGSKLEITAGEVANPATWSDTAIYDANNARMWGICQPTNSGAAIQGYIYWGTGAALVYSRDSNQTIVINDTEWTDTDFTQIIFAHASNDIEWDNVGLLALGTSNRGIIDVTANGAITWTNSVFQGIDITNLLLGSTFDGTKWLSCNEVTAGGASLLGCKILTPSVVADSHGLLWNTTGDPDGELDGMEFSKGTNAHHAIEFDATNSPTSITLRGIDFTGFHATNGNNDSALYFPSTTKSYTVNLVGCTGDISYKVGAGGSVTLVEDPVTLTITVQNTSGTKIENARALITAGTGGPFPSQVTVTITTVTTTASVAHTAHGLTNGDKVLIYGAVENELNGVQTISNVSTDAYDYTITSIGGASGTGTIKSTFVIINALTSATGIVSDTRTYSSDQLLGTNSRIRKASGSPYYKTGPVVGTVDSTAGASITVVLLDDE